MCVCVCVCVCVCEGGRKRGRECVEEGAIGEERQTHSADRQTDRHMETEIDG